MPLNCGLGGAKTAAAVVLPVHPKLTRLSGCLGIEGAEILPDGLKPVLGRKGAKQFPAVVKELVRGDRERRRHALEPALGGDAASLVESQRIARPTPCATIETMGRRHLLPAIAVVSGNDDVDVRDIASPRQKRS